MLSKHTSAISYFALLLPRGVLCTTHTHFGHTHTRCTEKGFKPSNVYAFGSRTLPLIAVLMVVQHPVVVYVDDSAEDEEYFDDHQREMLKHYGCSYTEMSGKPEANKHDANTIVVQVPL